MEKTRLGISVGMLGAAMYFFGLISVVALVIVGGYVLLFESNEWLKKTVIKAMAVVIGFTLLSLIISFGNDIFNILNAMLSWFNSTTRITWPLELDSIASGAINALEKLTLFILAIKAFTYGDVKIAPIDKVIEKNM